jgi:cardiolipin synthase
VSHLFFPAVGSYPVRTGNAVRPLIDGVPTFRRIGAAIDAARHSVWLTVAAISPDFQMPDGRGSLFDVLDRAVARGLDVRVIFWRADPAEKLRKFTFSGSQADRDMLEARGARFRVRWDQRHGRFSQHQKSWLIDAGRPSEVAFVGGINLVSRAMSSPGHAEGRRHDVYVEVSGPAATDVHHNFVQRWNEASERTFDDGRWGHGVGEELPFPTHLSDSRGHSIVQIQRNVRAGLYTDGCASPGGVPYNIADGERTIFNQYLLAISAARETIYIENPTIRMPPIVAALDEALKRGVDVVVLLPTQPKRVRNALFDPVARLGRHEHFALVGIAASGGRRNIHVHSKIMLVDDAWGTIGSGNLHHDSMSGNNTEMNASFWDTDVVRALRCALLAEHLGENTAHLDARAALQLYRRVARENRRRRDAGDHNWQGLTYLLDPATYGNRARRERRADALASAAGAPFQSAASQERQMGNGPPPRYGSSPGPP